MKVFIIDLIINTIGEIKWKQVKTRLKQRVCIALNVA